MNPRVGQLADLLTIEAVPPPSAELLVEVYDELSVDKVDESVAHVAGVVLVDRQIEEVDLHFVVATDLLIKHLLGVLVGDVADHECRPSIVLDLCKRGSYFIRDDLILLDLLSRCSSSLALRWLSLV